VEAEVWRPPGGARGACDGERAAGVGKLLQVVEHRLNGKRSSTPRLPELDPQHRAAASGIASQISGWVPAPYPTDWAALKLLEGDSEISRRMQTALPPENWQAVQTILVQHDDAMLAIASARYEWIGRMVRAALVRPRLGQISLTDRIDRWAAHPLWGLVILAGILGLVFGLTFTIGAPLQTWLDSQVVGGISAFASQALARAPFWLRGLVVDGVIAGWIGAHLSAHPGDLLRRLCLLEDMGYMARRLT